MKQMLYLHSKWFSAHKKKVFSFYCQYDFFWDLSFISQSTFDSVESFEKVNKYAIQIDNIKYNESNVLMNSCRSSCPAASPFSLHKLQ